MIASDTRELALGELDQVTGGGASSPGGAGPAPALSAILVFAAVAGIGFAVGAALGRFIKGEE